MRGNETPGARPSTAMIAMSRWPAPSPVWHTTRNRSASPASDTHALRPLTRQLCPSGRATVVIAVASDPACGSVSEKPPSASPVRSRSPHVAISSGDPAPWRAAATALCIDSENAKAASPRPSCSNTRMPSGYDSPRPPAGSGTNSAVSPEPAASSRG